MFVDPLERAWTSADAPEGTGNGLLLLMGIGSGLLLVLRLMTVWRTA